MKTFNSRTFHGRDQANEHYAACIHYIEALWEAAASSAEGHYPEKTPRIRIET